MTLHKKKILIVTPRFPYPDAGACEQDRAEGFRQLKRFGCDIRVIGKAFDWQDARHIREVWEKEDVPVTLVPYVYTAESDNVLRWKKNIFVLTHPWYADGSVLEYTEPKMRNIFRNELDTFHPDLVWFDYTYLWPLYRFVASRHIPIVVRSINFEAKHFLEEDGRTLLNYIKYLPKYRTEIISARRADLLFSITPYEERLYESIGVRHVANLPLRGIAKTLGTHTPKETDQLHVYFSGSTYNVFHNRKALEFILKDIAPKIFKKHGDRFLFHITGSKFPDDLTVYIRDNVLFEGFVDDLTAFTKGMDIALVPSLYGAGMQQKIFEPLARGFPTITHERGLAEYDFVPGEDVLVAHTAEEFLIALESLQSVDVRLRLSDRAKKKGEAQFSQNVVDGIVKEALEQLI